MLNSAVAVCTCVSAPFRLVASTCTFDRILSSIVTNAFSTSWPRDLNNQVFTFNLDQSRGYSRQSWCSNDHLLLTIEPNQDPEIWILTFLGLFRLCSGFKTTSPIGPFPAYERMPRSRSWCFDVIPWCTAEVSSRDNWIFPRPFLPHPTGPRQQQVSDHFTIWLGWVITCPSSWIEERL